MIYVIPRKLTAYIVNKEKCKKNNRDLNLVLGEGSELILFGPDGNSGTRNQIKTSISNVSRYSINSKPEDLFNSPIEISNTGLRLMIPTDPDVIDRFRYAYCSSNSLVEISSPELETGKHYYTFLDLRSFLEAIGSGRNIIDKKLSGTYCFEINKVNGGLRMIPRLEDITDLDQNEARRIGRLLENCTSKHELGGLYMKKDHSMYIYLGSLSKNYLINTYSYYYKTFSMNNNILANSGRHEENNSLPLYINVNKDTVDKWRGVDIKDLLSEIVCGSDKLNLSTKKISASKIDNILYVEDDFNSAEYVRGMCLKSIGKTPVNKMSAVQLYQLLYLPEKIEELKDEILECKRKIILGDYSFFMSLLRKQGESTVRGKLKNIKDTGKFSYQGSYTNDKYEDYFVGSSMIFSNEDLEKNIDIMNKMVLKELGLNP